MGQGAVEVAQRTAARRIPREEGDGGPLAPNVRQVEVFDRDVFNGLFNQAMQHDPLLMAITNLWNDKQEYGRIAYDSAYKHPVIGAAFDGRMAILTSKRPKFKPRTRDPTPTQQEMVDFANDLLDRIVWTRFIDGVIAQGLKYGFSLAEITTRYDFWKGKRILTLHELVPLPQPTLDNGFIPRHEMPLEYFAADGRYRCFLTDVHGRIIEVRQFAYKDFAFKSQPEVSWKGDELQYIAHFKHMGGDGNPFGQSLLYTSMEPWADHYAIGKAESVFLDSAQPITFGTYTTQNGRSRPDLHTTVENSLDNMYVDAAHRFLMWADGDMKSVAASNPNFTDHVFKKKAELEGQMWQAMGFPKSLISETAASDTDSRNLVQVFFKHIVKRELMEIGEFLEDIVGRFLRANYGENVEKREMPKIHWSLVTENETRVAQNLITAILPHLDSDRLPDFVHEMFEFIDPIYIAKTHKDSVELKRPKRDSNDEPNTVVGDPPPKEEGETRERVDGETENPSGVVNTTADQPLVGTR